MAMKIVFISSVIQHITEMEMLEIWAAYQAYLSVEIPLELIYVDSKSTKK